MEKVKVFWKSRAILHLRKQAKWYNENMGSSAADKFWKAMIAAGDLLSSNPYLGKIEPIFHNSTHKYRSLIQHKDFKIIYYIDEDKAQIHIVSIWHCQNNVYPI